jgi:hypothetical protein
MALVLKDRVKESTITTGTGAYSMAGAAVGFQDFSVIGNANTTYYAVTDGTDWEVGIGTYTASGTSLSRDLIFESSNSGNAVNWGAGTKDIFVTLPAERAIAPTKLTVTDRSGTPVEVPLLNGFLIVTNRSGALISVAVQ